MRETVIGQAPTTSAETSERATAFRLLADGQLHESYRLANAILGHPSEAEDAVHDAIVSAWQRWSTLRERSKFEAWFRRIVINTCRNRLKQGSRRRTSDIAEQSGLTVSDESPQVHDREQLEGGLARLKPDDRVLLALRYYRDLRIEDIAELLDVPTGTVKSRLNRAHQRLRAVLDHPRSEGTPR